MQRNIYRDAIKAFHLARETRNRDAARDAITRAKIALALVQLGYE